MFGTYRQNGSAYMNAATQRFGSGFSALFGRSEASPSRGTYELVDNAAEQDASGSSLVTATSPRPLRDDAIDGKPSDSPSYVSQTIDDGDLDHKHLESSESWEDEHVARLRKVPEDLPSVIFLIAVIELLERSSYYGLAGLLQNYSSGPGGLGLGPSAATGLVNLLTFWAYVCPVAGAVVADAYLGRYLTILYSSFVYTVGLLILFITSLPVSINNGAGLGGLITAIVLIGIGTGGIKSNVSPLIAEQYTRIKPTVKILESGERVVIDPTLTVQRIYMVFYACINIGSLSPIITTYLEKFIGFWSAFLLCTILFVFGSYILIGSRNRIVSQPPKGSVIPSAFRICYIALKNGGNLDAAKVEYGAQLGRQTMPWDDRFVNEVRRALIACRVFSFYGIYWAAYSQMLSTLVTQAGQMDVHSIPNDLMQVIDPITILIFIPVMDRLVYPALRRLGMPFKPITRISVGFMLAAAAMAYAALVQTWIYSSGPCYDAPLKCPAASQPDGSTLPNQIHVAYQIPAYLLIGLSEIFASITGLEYAFTKAPASMKSFIMAIFLLQSAVGAGLGAALAPLAIDPKLVWLYTGLAIAVLGAGLLFWWLFKKYNDAEEDMNRLEHGDRVSNDGDLDSVPLAR